MKTFTVYFHGKIGEIEAENAAEARGQAYEMLQDSGAEFVITSVDDE